MVAELHLVQQTECRPDIRAFVKGATSAIDHDIGIPLKGIQMILQFSQISLFARRPDVIRSLDHSTWPYTDNVGLLNIRVIYNGRKVGRFHQLIRSPGFGLLNNEAKEEAGNQYDQYTYQTEIES